MARAPRFSSCSPKRDNVECLAAISADLKQVGSSGLLVRALGEMHQNRCASLCALAVLFFFFLFLVVCQNRTGLQPAAGDVRSLSPPVAKPSGSRACVTVPAVNILPRTIYKVSALLPATNPDLSQESSTQIGRICGTRAREKGRGGGGGGGSVGGWVGGGGGVVGSRFVPFRKKCLVPSTLGKRLNWLKQL